MCCEIVFLRMILVIREMNVYCKKTRKKKIRKYVIHANSQQPRNNHCLYLLV